MGATKQDIRLKKYINNLNIFDLIEKEKPFNKVYEIENLTKDIMNNNVICVSNISCLISKALIYHYNLSDVVNEIYYFDITYLENKD